MLEIYAPQQDEPVARPAIQGWQNCLVESCDTKSESLFQILCYHNCQNQMDKCVHKERINCLVKAKLYITKLQEISP